MICEVCGHQEFKTGAVSETFRVDDKLYLVEGIPARVCTRCGEASFSAEVSEQVYRLIHGPHPAKRVIQTEVLDYCAA